MGCGEEVHEGSIERRRADQPHGRVGITACLFAIGFVLSRTSWILYKTTRLLTHAMILQMLA